MTRRLTGREPPATEPDPEPDPWPPTPAAWRARCADIRRQITEETETR